MRDHSIEALQATFTELGQGHLFAGWERRPAAFQQRLIATLAALDRSRLRQLREVLRRQEAGATAAQPAAAIKPPPVAVPAAGATVRWESLGREYLTRGTSALLTVAGGQGTRLGFDAPKGMFPVTPIRKASLFQLFAERLLAARATYRAAIPWYVMTSPLNHAATAAFFAAHGHFGLPAADVLLFPQGVNPALTATGDLLLAPGGGLLQSPDGHGGVLTALQRAGVAADAERRGVSHLFYFQVDNPLVTIPDPAFLGAHLEACSQFSTKVVTKGGAAEKVGVAALVDGRPGIVEYSDLDPALAAARTATGELRLRYGSIAVHLIDLAFATERAGALPIHLAHKRERVLAPPAADQATGRVVTRDVVKFEQFVFDAIPLAERSLFFAVERAEEYAPLKNRSGDDSIDTCTAGQILKAVRWLRRCGVEVAAHGQDGAPLVVEISPLYAAGVSALQQRLGAAVTKITDHTLLDR